jgi:hypothetical protein
MDICKCVFMYDASQLKKWGQRPRLSIRKSITAPAPTAAAEINGWSHVYEAD